MNLKIAKVELKEKLSPLEFWYLLRNTAKANPCDMFYFMKIDFPYAEWVGRMTFGTPNWASVIRLKPEGDTIYIEKDPMRYRLVEKYDELIRKLIRCSLQKLQEAGIIKTFEVY